MYTYVFQTSKTHGETNLILSTKVTNEFAIIVFLKQIISVLKAPVYVFYLSSFFYAFFAME